MTRQPPPLIGGSGGALSARAQEGLSRPAHDWPPRLRRQVQGRQRGSPGPRRNESAGMVYGKAYAHTSRRRVAIDQHTRMSMATHTRMPLIRCRLRGSPGPPGPRMKCHPSADGGAAPGISLARRVPTASLELSQGLSISSDSRRPASLRPPVRNLNRDAGSRSTLARTRNHPSQ
jgi:hypothetical protein